MSASEIQPATARLHAAAKARDRLPPRAIDLGLIACDTCGLVLHDSGHKGYCSRCEAALHRRIPRSLERSTAYLLAAAILYIPANLLPMMHTVKLREIDDPTILSGVVELWQDGAWDLAVIVFTASIAVPLLKIGVIASLLFTTWRGSRTDQLQRTRLYRVIEFIGRWSMLDVFVVALLVTLVHFGLIAQVRPGGAILPFCAVVVLTMLSARSFDPRLIWDAR